MNRFRLLSGNVKRTQRHPQYTDDQLPPFFFEVSLGYCFKQSTARCGYEWETLRNTIYSDEEVFAHALNLSMAAGALIRKGKQAVPNRWDGLYDEYLTDNNKHCVPPDRRRLDGK